jgi:1-acyl-sn-glycerol-3-phosphate acyltransferase
MSEHLIQKPLAELVERNEKIVFPAPDFSTKSKISGKLRYWWSWVFPSFMFLFVAPPVMLVAAIFRRKHWLYPLCHWGAKNWLRWCGAKVNLKGEENVEKGKSYIFVANHKSYLDTATMFAYMGRRMGFLAKKELAQVPIVGTLMPFVNILKIDRSNSQKALETMKEIRKVFEKGISIGIFVEGTRAYPGDFLPFKKGAFHLALQTHAPIVPVVIKNTDWIMGKKTGLAYPGTIEVTILPPIATENLQTEDLDELMKKARGMMAEELSESV